MSINDDISKAADAVEARMRALYPGHFDNLDDPNDGGEEDEAPSEDSKVRAAEDRINILLGGEKEAIEHEVKRLTIYREALRQVNLSEAEAQMEARREQIHAGVMDGLEFMKSTINKTPIWGTPDSPAWASGESTEIVAPTGVGKSWIAVQLALHLAGVRGGEFLGMPVARPEHGILYLAYDRPDQISRMLRLMAGNLTPEQASAMVKRTTWSRNRLGIPVTSNPRVLLEFVKDIEARDNKQFSVIFIDSLKDITDKLSDDVGGTAIANAMNELIAAGYEVLATHHVNKSKADGTDSSFGSSLITAGFGSVLRLEGKAGADTIKLKHDKQPASPVQTMAIIHGREDGTSRIATEAEAAQASEVMSIALEGVLDTVFAAANRCYPVWRRGEENGEVTKGMSQADLVAWVREQDVSINQKDGKKAAKFWKEGTTLQQLRNALVVPDVDLEEWSDTEPDEDSD